MGKGKGSRARWAWDAWGNGTCVAFGRRAQVGALLADVDHAVLDLGATQVWVRWTGNQGWAGMAANWDNGGWQRVDDPAIRAALGWADDDGAD